MEKLSAPLLRQSGNGRRFVSPPFVTLSFLTSFFTSLKIARGFIRQNTVSATAKNRIDYPKETRGKMTSDTVLLLVLGIA
jgi:hypothetical protein